MRLALCQMNATVGDIDGNAQRIREGMRAAGEAGAELVLFPELALTGYPPEDLLLKEHFLADARAALDRIALATDEIVALVGFPERAPQRVAQQQAVGEIGRRQRRHDQGAWMAQQRAKVDHVDGIGSLTVRT